MNPLITEIEIQEKVDLAMNLAPETFCAKSIFKLQVSEVKIELLYQGDFYDSTAEFLQNYFRNFESFTGLADISIHYWQLPGKLGDCHWTMWNIWTHELEFRRGTGQNDQYDVLIQRDFVAKVDNNGSKIFAHGPIWSFGTCDSLDNIISYALGRQLIKYQGVILHAACVVKDDLAYVFFGASGAGKSTLAEHCYKKHHLKVISSDQLIIKFWGDKLFAQVMPTTIPEFPLDHPAREIKPLPVKCLLHLVQQTDTPFAFKELESIDWLKFFMRELVYRNEFACEQEILDLSLKIASKSDIIKGEMSYEKGSDFFSQLEQIMTR